QGWEAVAEKTETKKEELKDKLRGKREKVQPSESALPEVVQDPLPGEPTPEGQFIEADDWIMLRDYAGKLGILVEDLLKKAEVSTHEWIPANKVKSLIGWLDSKAQE